MSFASQTFERIKNIYDGMEEFGPAPLYAAISFLIEDGNLRLAHACLTEAAAIHGHETFIVEGETRNNDVFIEVFRRTAFSEPGPGEDPETMRATVSYVGHFLHQFAINLEANNGKLVLQQEAANDGDS